ncbi:unnamed protein product [Mytilus edulis]|uniref:Uncharacterized protein n=1 Tax=Mytilus edulis TaxID=6550 RepID=A0A8S3V969_MYTED|nr:unnamed protein product [Mytilus edulis]
MTISRQHKRGQYRSGTTLSKEMRDAHNIFCKRNSSRKEELQEQRYIGLNPFLLAANDILDKSQKTGNKSSPLVTHEVQSTVHTVHHQSQRPDGSQVDMTGSIMISDFGRCFGTFEKHWKMHFNGTADTLSLEILRMNSSDFSEFICKCGEDDQDMPETFNRSAEYTAKQVEIHISTKKVFPMLKCNTTYYETFSKCNNSIFCNQNSSTGIKHVEEILQQHESFKVSNFTFYKADSVLIVNMNDLTCSAITLQVKCHVGSKPFSFSVSAEVDCNFFQTIGLLEVVLSFAEKDAGECFIGESVLILLGVMDFCGVHECFLDEPGDEL